jgi:hypothetical protein
MQAQNHNFVGSAVICAETGLNIRGKQNCDSEIGGVSVPSSDYFQFLYCTVQTRVQ